MALFKHLKGDLTGAVTVGIISLPGNIAFGLIAFAPLGPAHMGQGILAGMFSSIFAGVVASLFGSTNTMISGPAAPAALIFASVIAQLAAAGLLAGPGGVEIVLAVSFFILERAVDRFVNILRLCLIIKFVLA